MIFISCVGGEISSGAGKWVKAYDFDDDRAG